MRGARTRIHFVDVGVSGGVWGLEVGFCLMAGGDDEPVKRLEPIFKALAPEDGYAHVGPSGAGHFTKMVHNGIEYGLMQAYAEGFEVMHASEFDLDLHEIAGIWRYGSVVRSWLLELLHAAFEKEGGHLEAIRGYVEDSGRGPLDDRRGDRRGRAGAGDQRGALRALRLAPGGVVRGEGQRGAAQPVRRPCGPRRRGRQGKLRPPLMAVKAPAAMPEQENPLLEGLRLRGGPEPCALVIFGASGDLTQRKLFPALYSLAFRRLLPEQFAIVGVARTEQSTEDWIAEMKKAVQEHGRDEFREDVWDGSPPGCATSRDGLRRRRRRGRARADAERARRGARDRRATASTTSRFRRTRSRRSSTRARQAACRQGLDAADRREAVRPRPRLRARAERGARRSTSPRARSSGSTTTSARRRSRTCSRCASRTASSSRSGTASSSTTSRSPSPSRSGSRAARRSTSRPARSATSSRTTCCSSSR